MQPPNRWHTIDRLFAEALDRAPDERAAFLDEACGGDEALRREVEMLLAAGEATGTPLDTPLEECVLWQAFAAEAPAPVPSLEEKQVGVYRLIEEIGRGGMGAVYRAERADGQFDQQAAVKVLRRSASRAVQVERFLSERQILASLHHPHIAALHDGGMTAGGRPYFVMEYVEGRAIDRYCDEEHLPLEERLDLFASVGEAVQYAHQNLIVHRDLKPSNVLVAEDGTPKLLDFGIAKLLTEDSGRGAPVTRTAERWMTPEYASPEQVRGEAITTASDVYQLGLVLYKLVTGKHPYQLDARSAAEVERVICETAPTRPSTAIAPDQAAACKTTPERMGRALRGDLDTIVLKALRKEPARRYASAEAFVADIRRYRDGLPVKARPATLGYRARKFAHRHRWGVTLAALMLLSLLAGLAGTTWQARRAARQAELAAQERRKAEQVTAFLMGLFEASDPREARGDTITARVLLRRGVARAEALEGQPEVQAQMFSVIGRVYHSLGTYDRAAALLERALTLRRVPGGEMSPLLAARTRYHLAMARHGQGRYAEAFALLQGAARGFRAAEGTAGPVHAASLYLLAQFYATQGKYAAADSLHREALAMRRGRYGNEHPKVAESLTGLARVRKAQGDLATAERLVRRALSIQRTAPGVHQPAVATSLAELGGILQAKGAPAAAEPLFREALAIKKRIYGARHPRVGAALDRLADLLRAQGRDKEASLLYQEALTVFREAYGAESLMALRVLVDRAALQCEQGAAEDAVPLLRTALLRYRKLLQEAHPRVADVRYHLGACLMALGRYGEAERHLLKSHASFQALDFREDDARRAVEALAALYEAWGRSEQAAAYQALLAGAAGAERP